MDAFARALAPRVRSSAQAVVSAATAQVQEIVTSTALLTAALTTVGVVAATVVGVWVIRQSQGAG